MRPTTKNKILPLAVLGLTSLLVIPLTMAMVTRTPPNSQASTKVTSQNCPPQTQPQIICNNDPQTPQCQFKCLPLKSNPSPSPTCPTEINCPLDCITVSNQFGCDICRCDVK